MFVGNSAFSSELLKAKIKLRDSRYGVTKYMFNAADRDAMHEDQQTLETYYRRLGYFDAKVDHFIEYDEDGKFITLTFAVSEGKQYFINELMVRGNKYHTDEELLAAVKIQPGEAYNQDRADRDTKFIRDIYGAQGFIFCEVTPTIIYLPQNRVNLLFEVSEGDVYVASDIRVHIDGDNSYTKERVALSMIGNLRPGRVIDSREIEAAERRLQFSQIFETNPQVGSPPRIDVQPSNDDDEPKR